MPPKAGTYVHEAGCMIISYSLLNMYVKKMLFLGKKNLKKQHVNKMKKKMPALKTGYFSLDVLYGCLELQNDNNNNKT